MSPSWIARVFQLPSKSSRRSRRTARRAPVRSFRPSLEVLEARTLLSVAPVSIDSAGTAMGDHPSSAAMSSVSANGQYSVFTSYADDLVAGLNASNAENVYRRDLVNGMTSMVSIDTAGTGGVAAGDAALAPTITADGRYVAFASDSPGLTNNDTGPAYFVRDMQQGQTYLVSLAYEGGSTSIGESNGQLVVAYNSVDSNGNSQVYVATFQLNSSTGDIQYNSLTNKLVSATSTGSSGNQASYYPVLSQDGSTLTFNSQATNLNVFGGYNDNSGGVVRNLYLYSVASGKLTLLSAEPTTGTNATGNGISSISEESLPGAAPASPQTVSGNGQYAVFTSGSDNLVAGLAVFDASNVYRRNLTTGTTDMVSINDTGTGGVGTADFARTPVITADGRYVAFDSNSPGLTSNDTGSAVYVRDMQQGQTYLVGLYNADYSTAQPSIGESNGQLVIAYTAANSSSSQVYVATLGLDSSTGDIQYNTLTTKLASATSSSSGGNGYSYLPLLSKDGSTLAFLSDATNLNGETGNGYYLLFSYNVAAGTLTQVSPALEANTQVSAFSVSISDHGDIAYVLDHIDAQNDTALYGWNAGTGRNIVIPQVLYPQGNNGPEYGVSDGSVVSISGDGSTVAFAEGDVFGNGYVFATSNWQSGSPTDTQISQTVGSSLNGDTVYGSGDPSISDNGKVIAYVLQFNRSNLYEAYVSNNGTITEASPATSGGNSNGNAGPVAVSSDGSTVFFNSLASNLMPKTTLDFTAYGGLSQFYAYSVAHKKVSLVSAKAPGLFAADNTSTDTTSYNLSSASLSDTGRYVAFWSSANDLQGNLLAGYNAFAEDTQKGVPMLVSGFGPDNGGDLNVQNVVISGDGSTVAYANYGSGQIYSRNWLVGRPTTTLVSVNSAGTGGGNGLSENPSISDNGQVMAFDSYANNLTSNDADAGGYSEIFVRNLAKRTTTLASPNSSGTDGGNANSITPFLSSDGSTVIFNSQATNLVAGVTVPSTSTENVYAMTLGPSAEIVNSDVSITLGSISYNSAKHEYQQTVTIQNTSGATLQGPLALVLTNLSSNATLANAGGTWLGDPYINFVSSTGHLAAGQSITVTLYFRASSSNITYGTQVWQNI